MANWQNRIVGQGVKPASQFLANPLNWRLHPQFQREAVKGSLETLGWIQQVIENKTTGNLIDGHERVWQAMDNDDAEVPYIEVELTEEEERQALATLDPLSALASTDFDKLKELTEGMKLKSPYLKAMIDKVKGIQVNPSSIWKGMPEFEQDDQTGYQIHIHFRNQKDIQTFAELIKQPITDKTKALWFPAKQDTDLTKYKALDES